MKRLLALFILLLAIGLGRLVPAAHAADNGVITGHVVEGTAGATLGSGLTVKLEGITASGASTDQFQTRTTPVADDGSFRFDGLPITTDYSYLASLEYQSVPYLAEIPNQPSDAAMPAQVLTLTDAAPTLDVSLKVYESTSAEPGLRATLEHLVVMGPSGTGTGAGLVVLDVINLNNPSDRTWVGQAASGTTPASALHVALPTGATFGQAEMGFDPGNPPVSSGDGFDTTQSMPPGDTSLGFTFTVLFQGTEDSATLERAFSFPTDKVTVLIPDVGVKIDSPQFTDWQSTTQSGQPYLSASMTGAQKGSTITLNFSNLPKANANVAPSGSGGSSNRTLYIIVGVGILAALALVGLYLRLRGQLAAGGYPAGGAPAGGLDGGPDGEPEPAVVGGTGAPAGEPEGGGEEA